MTEKPTQLSIPLNPIARAAYLRVMNIEKRAVVDQRSRSIIMQYTFPDGRVWQERVDDGPNDKS